MNSKEPPHGHDRETGEAAPGANRRTWLHVCCTSPKFIKTLGSEFLEVALRVDFRALERTAQPVGTFAGTENTI